MIYPASTYGELTDEFINQREGELRMKVVNHEPLSRDEVIEVFNFLSLMDAQLKEAREIACQLLTIAEARGPKVFGNGGRFPWLKKKRWNTT